ncbi:MAG: 4Fe-4S binding protein [Desulfobacterales bacterium]
MTDQEIYQKFVEYMGHQFPESEHMMPMITSFLSPEEADFITGFPMNAKTIEEIAQMKQMEIPELEGKISALARKGVIYESIRGDSVRYRLWSGGEIFQRVPFWPGTDEEPIRTMAHHGNKYYDDGLIDDRKHIVHPGLRSVPIDETVMSPSEFLPFEDIKKLVEGYDYCTVSYCCCRMRYNLDSDYPDSPFPLETCLHFNELGRYIVKNGLGREITKDETFEILKKAADAGLVHGLENHQGNPETICNCDLEYCTFLRPYHQMGHAKAIEPSNYVVQVTPETCKACGICIKRCPMDAIQLKLNLQATNKFRKAVTIDADVCIGCGVCVHKCNSI